jgi:radical SAM superfamily enzyme YgiQ (UPF0313 family)
VNWVIGIPGETEADISEGIDLILRNKQYIGRLANINTLILSNGSVYYLDPESHKIKFREDKEQLYEQFARGIPEQFWYSEEPYIDGAVRRARFRRIILALRDGGFNIGAWATKVVDDTFKLDEASPEDSPPPSSPKASDAAQPAAIATSVAAE